MFTKKVWRTKINKNYFDQLFFSFVPCWWDLYTMATLRKKFRFIFNAFCFSKKVQYWYRDGNTNYLFEGWIKLSTVFRLWKDMYDTKGLHFHFVLFLYIIYWRMNSHVFIGFFSNKNSRISDHPILLKHYSKQMNIWSDQNFYFLSVQ
jgi:hypothetical protein